MRVSPRMMLTNFEKVLAKFGVQAAESVKHFTGSLALEFEFALALGVRAQRGGDFDDWHGVIIAFFQCLPLPLGVRGESLFLPQQICFDLPAAATRVC
jgi:hypothetical protein